MLINWFFARIFETNNRGKCLKIFEKDDQAGNASF